MNVYIYAADLFCEDCGQRIRQELDEQGKTPQYPNRESTYDSDDYPKGPYPDGGGESDSVQHCDEHNECINALVLSNGCKIGVWLENPLTQDGVKIIKNMIEMEEKNNSYNEVLELWKQWYSEELSYES